MKNVPTTPDSGYVLTPAALPCTITASVNGTTVTLVNATRAGQYSFVAPGSQVTVSQDDALISPTSSAVAFTGTGR